MRPDGLPEKQGLYDPRFERDSCGVGFVVNVDGISSHLIILMKNYFSSTNNSWRTRNFIQLGASRGLWLRS